MKKSKPAKSEADPDQGAKVPLKSGVHGDVERVQTSAPRHTGVGVDTTAMIWDGYPDGAFDANFDEEDFVATGRLMIHWCHYVNCGDRRGSKFATEWNDGLRKVMQCRGIITCTNSACSRIKRTPTKPGARNAALKGSCPCGSPRRWEQCNVEMETKEWEGGVHVFNSGRHVHGRPPRTKNARVTHSQAGAGASKERRPGERSGIRFQAMPTYLQYGDKV